MERNKDTKKREASPTKSQTLFRTNLSLKKSSINKESKSISLNKTHINPISLSSKSIPRINKKNNINAT